MPFLPEDGITVLAIYTAVSKLVFSGEYDDHLFEGVF
jgi:hypothetical protein